MPRGGAAAQKSRVLVVFNPAAGRRRADRVWRVLDILTASGIRVEVARTTGVGHATCLARDAVRAGERLVVAAGGDGTVAEVAAGLSGAPARLGIIPVGTANVLAQELRLPRSPRDLAAVLAFGRGRTIWPGLARGPAGPGTLFVQMLGAGFDAQVVHAVGPRLKRALGRHAYVVQGVREALRYGFEPIDLAVDGQVLRAGSVIVSKGELYGGAYRLARGASPRAPGFTVALFQQGGWERAMLYGAALPLNLLPRMPGVRFLRGSEISIRTQIPAQADGGPLGRTPLTVVDAPAPLEVLAP
jgi:diacylglycerol kinase family enzyme